MHRCLREERNLGCGSSACSQSCKHSDHKECRSAAIPVHRGQTQGEDHMQADFQLPILDKRKPTRVWRAPSMALHPQFGEFGKKNDAGGRNTP
eukprot:1161029-Pelagomonas_calceolata.AAC.5